MLGVTITAPRHEVKMGHVSICQAGGVICEGRNEVSLLLWNLGGRTEGANS